MRKQVDIGHAFPGAEMAGWLASYTDAPRLYHEVILLGLHGCGRSRSRMPRECRG